MCNFFSFIYKESFGFLYLGACDRKRHPTTNHDSHTVIAKSHLFFCGIEDSCNKYEYSNGKLTIDYMADRDLHIQSNPEVWIAKFVKTKKWKRICEAEIMIRPESIRYINKPSKKLLSLYKKTIKEKKEYLAKIGLQHIG